MSGLGQLSFLDRRPSGRLPRKKRLLAPPWLCLSTDLGGKLSMSALLWKWLSVILCLSLWYPVVAAGLAASRFHSLVLLSLQVEREGSVFGDQLVMTWYGPFTIITKLFSKGVKPERVRLTASEKSSRTSIGDSVTLSSLLKLSTFLAGLKDSVLLLAGLKYSVLLLAGLKYSVLLLAGLKYSVLLLAGLKYSVLLLAGLKYSVLFSLV